MRLLVGTLFLGIFTLSASQSLDKYESRIKGGQDALINEFPYQASIRVKKEFQKGFANGHICGGSLISTRMVELKFFTDICFDSKKTYF